MKADIKVRNGKPVIRCGRYELHKEVLDMMDGVGGRTMIAIGDDLDALYAILRTWFLLKEREKVTRE